MDAGNLLSSIVLLTFLGLLLAFNPMLIVVDILLVLKTKRPIFNTVMLLLGFGTSVLIIFSLANLLIGPSSDIDIEILKNLDLPPVIDVVAGSLLFAYGLGKFFDAKLKPAQAVKKINFEIPQGPLKIYAFGVVKSFLSVSNLVAILLLTRQAISGNWSLGISTLALVWLIIIGFLPLFYIMYMHWFKNESLQKIDARINDWLGRDTSKAVSLGMVVVGATLLAKGSFEIISS